MAKYLVSFPSAAVIVTDGEWDAVGRDSHAVIDEPNPFPDPWLALIVGSRISFIIGLACASAIVSTHCWFTRLWRNRKLKLS